MTGKSLDDHHGRGIMPRLSELVLSKIDDADANLEFTVCVSYIENIESLFAKQKGWG